MGYLDGVDSDTPSAFSIIYLIPPTTSKGWRALAEKWAVERKFHYAGWALWNAQQFEIAERDQMPNDGLSNAGGPVDPREDLERQMGMDH